MSRGTLAEKIAGILNTAPSSIDPEEEIVDDTEAQITLGEEKDAEEKEEEILSKFRKQNIDLLGDIDEKYAGKKTTRKSLGDSSDDDDESSEVEENDTVEEDEDDDGSEEEEEEEEIDLLGCEKQEFGSGKHFKHINDVNVSNQVKKGLCVRNQMSMWENLLEIRIQLQKCLLTANKMPKSSKFIEIKTESGPEFTKQVSDVKNAICRTLDKLLLLQKLALKQYPETRNLENQTNENLLQADNEEIPSDTEPELSEEEAPEIIIAKKRKLEEYEKDIDDQHKKYKSYRNEVIRKWHDKTKVVLRAGATSHSVLDQIEFNLSNNRDKLIKRTQLKRSEYKIVGDEGKTDKTAEEYSTEIFDDDDFYHQLLRELIEVKSADITDPVQLGRQWIQLQNMRSKMKRKVDTRATKGRKIRYVVHNKLVNFMGPIDAESWTEEAKTELYSSLFGRNQSVITQ